MRGVVRPHTLTSHSRTRLLCGHARVPPGGGRPVVGLCGGYVRCVRLCESLCGESVRGRVGAALKRKKPQAPHRHVARDAHRSKTGADCEWANLPPPRACKRWIRIWAKKAIASGGVDHCRGGWSNFFLHHLSGRLRLVQTQTRRRCVGGVRRRRGVDWTFMGVVLRVGRRAQSSGQERRDHRHPRRLP